MKIMNIANQAIMKQSQRLAESAKNVAKAGDINGEGANVDLAKEAVTRIEATNITKANLKVIQAEDERQKAILDIIA